MSNGKDFFDAPEFRRLLKRYEQMKAQGICSYFDTDELCDILSYYLFYEKREEVEEVYTLARRLHPGSPEITKMEIRILLTYGKAEAALQSFDSLPQCEDHDSMLLKAEVLLALKQYKASRTLARTVLNKSNITDDIAYDALEILLDCGFPQEVLDTVDNGLKHYPDNRNLLEVKAESLIELQKTDEAIEIYNKLLDENPYSTFYWEQLGHIYYMIERYGKALECFEYELTIDETIEYASMMQGYCYYRLRDYKSCIRIFDSFIERYPDNIMPLFYKALSLSQSGRCEEALEVYNSIITSNKSRQNSIEKMLAFINSSIIQYDMGNKKVAAEYMSKAMNHIPDMESIKQLLLKGGPCYELRDKENMMFRDLNITETKEWKYHEVMMSLGVHIFSCGYTQTALYPLYCAQATAPDTSDIDAYIAYILYTNNGGSHKEITELIDSALQGKSSKLFELLDIPYNANATSEEILRVMEIKCYT